MKHQRLRLLTLFFGSVGFGASVNFAVSHNWVAGAMGIGFGLVGASMGWWLINHSNPED